MRIQNNIQAIVANNALYQSNKALSTATERLSTGYRVNRAADDAAGLAISESLRTQIRGLNQAARNAEDGINFLQIADGATGEISNVLQRMRELAVQSANGIYGVTERGFLDDEFQALLLEVDRIVDSTEFNGQSMLSGGTGGDVTFQIGANDVSGVDNINIGINAVDTGTLLLTGDMIDTQVNANAAITAIDAAFSTLFAARAEMGSMQNRLESVINVNQNTAANSQAAESAIRDTDMAWEMTQFTKNQILVQSGVAMLSQANLTPQSILSLLR